MDDVQQHAHEKRRVSNVHQFWSDEYLQITAVGKCADPDLFQHRGVELVYLALLKRVRINLS